MRRLDAKDEGVTTVEFALVLPIFMLLIGIGAYFGWIFYSQAQLDRAAARAARFAAVPLSSTSSTASNIYSYCQDLILKRINDDLVSGKVDNADLTVSDAVPTTLASTSTCAADGSSSASPQGFVKVSISHDFTNPFAYIVAPFTGISTTLKLTGTGQVRVEKR